MLDADTRRRIDAARDILVGKVPDPKSQVEQITIALIYKFMDDMDAQSEELGGKRSFFADGFARYGWAKLMRAGLGGHDTLNLYADAITRMPVNPGIPPLFRDIFKNAYLPYRDPETLRAFLKIIDEFTYDHSERLGDAFEYLLSVLGSQGDAGQFRTPRHIIDFMVEVVDPKKDEKILDPACGTAGFLISAYKHILQANIGENGGSALTSEEQTRLAANLKGYDISPDMVRLSLANMYLHGFTDPHISEYDTLTSEDNWNEFADVILANPPFMSPKGGIRPHNRFSVNSKRSEVLFVDYMAGHLGPAGRAGIIVPEGIIFQSQNAYKQLRKMLVEGYLVAVVSLPAGVFQPYSGVKTSILILDKPLAKITNHIAFFKVENDGYDLGAQRRSIEGSDLPGVKAEIAEYLRRLRAGESLDDFEPTLGLIVEKEKIAENGEYNLSGERYRENTAQMTTYPRVEIGQISEFFTDGDWIESKDQSVLGIRLIQTGNIGFGEYLDKKENSRFISEETFERLNCTEVIPGDVLVSRLPDPVGRACIAPNLGTRQITAVDCSIIRFDPGRLLPELFVAFTKSEHYYKNIEGYLTGTTRPRISRGNLSKVQIPLPPLDIQKEIVAEIEGYQKVIDGARAVVDNYRPHIAVDPEWPMVALGEVFQLSSGRGLTQAQMRNGPYPVYGGNGRSGFHTEYFVDEPIIVIGRVGAYCGVVHITAPKAWVTDNGLYVTKYKREVDQHFLAHILTQLDLNQFAKVGGQPSISQVTVYECKVPLPPLETQQTDVAELEAEQTLVDANRKLIERFEKKIEAVIARVWGEDV